MKLLNFHIDVSFELKLTGALTSWTQSLVFFSQRQHIVLCKQCQRYWSFQQAAAARCEVRWSCTSTLLLLLQMQWTLRSDMGIGAGCWGMQEKKVTVRTVYFVLWAIAGCCLQCVVWKPYNERDQAGNSPVKLYFPIFTLAPPEFENNVLIQNFLWV